MKRIRPFLMTSLVLLAASCTSTEEATEDVVIQYTTYTLNTEATSLIWEGKMGPNYGHSGTISITDGIITMNGNNLVSGFFTIDMNSLKNTDLVEAGEIGKAKSLIGHLKGTIIDDNHPAELFFNVPVFPTTKVSLGEYKDGELTLTVSLLDKELSQEVPVIIISDENGATINGDFTLDFTSIGIPGLQPNENESQINPMIDFKLKIVMIQ